jgi:hypothetical protein
MHGLSRVKVFISGRNSGISGSAWSRFAKVVKPTQNGARSVFEGAKDAGEQQAGSSAASSLSPAAARGGCLRHMSFIRVERSATQMWGTHSRTASRFAPGPALLVSQPIAAAAAVHAACRRALALRQMPVWLHPAAVSPVRRDLYVCNWFLLKKASACL